MTLTAAPADSRPLECRRHRLNLLGRPASRRSVTPRVHPPAQRVDDTDIRQPEGVADQPVLAGSATGAQCASPATVVDGNPTCNVRPRRPAITGASAACASSSSAPSPSMSSTHAPATSPGSGIRLSNPATPIAESTDGTTSARCGRPDQAVGRPTNRACHTSETAAASDGFDRLDRRDARGHHRIHILREVVGQQIRRPDESTSVGMFEDLRRTV